MTEINITKIARNLSDIINRVSYKGERFTILRGKRPVAQLSPVPAGKTLGDLVRILAAAPPLSEDEATAFERDLAAIRRESSQESLEDPWASS